MEFLEAISCIMDKMTIHKRPTSFIIAQCQKNASTDTSLQTCIPRKLLSGFEYLKTLECAKFPQHSFSLQAVLNKELEIHLPLLQQFTKCQQGS